MTPHDVSREDRPAAAVDPSEELRLAGMRETPVLALKSERNCRKSAIK
jgi:hypothetical protein